MALLETIALNSAYGDFQALFGVNVHVDAGETVAVIGANGAGKSTLFKTVTGLLSAKSGSVMFDGRSIAGSTAASNPAAIARLGIAMVPEGRRLFPSLSVEENLLIGGHTRRTGPWNLRAVYELFPALADKRAAPSTSLSGGQQQMVAIGRALMSNPRLLICDELSLGLAPVVVKELYDALPRICAGGLTLVLVEQDVALAQRVSTRLYCLMHGRVTLSGESTALSREEISRAYFGV